MQTTHELKSVKRIILLNGPPGCGKDTIGRIISSACGALEEKFASPLKQSVPHIYDIKPSFWRNNMDIHGVKDQPHPLLFDKSPRDVQIAISEALLKPLHGEDVFGKIMANKLNASAAVNIVITDSGFQAEAEHLVDVFGPDSIMVWNIHRKGCSFDGDSRDWVDLTHLGVHQIPFTNDASLEEVGEDAQKIAYDFFHKTR